MTLPVGTISLAEVNVELGYSSTALISLNDTAVRTLAGVPSGQISMQNLQGKANQFAFTISSNQTNANLATLATAAGWNGTSKVVATISSGVYISSNATGTPALTVSGSFPGGVELVNNGYIVGMGGAGGYGGYNYIQNPSPGYAQVNGAPGSSGGLALSVSTAVSITNNGTIGGGGGGGGGGGMAMAGDYNYRTVSGGGGGSGGRTGTTNSNGGAAGTYWRALYPSAGADGAAGNVGTSSGGGAAAAGGYASANRGRCWAAAGAGGAGGTWGASGGTGVTGSGAAGSSYYPYVTFTTGGSGGAAGGAVTGNSNITWVATGTRLGSIS